MGKRRHPPGGGAAQPGGVRWTDPEAYGSAKRRSWRAFVPIWGAAALLGTAYGAGWFDRVSIGTSPVEAAETEETSEVRTSFGFCHTGGGYNCVVDGDTIWLEGQNIRIADIDAPETHEWRCSEEKALGDRATQRLLQLVNSGAISLRPIDRDADNYGRKLRLVYVDGTSVGDTLVDEGLARWYASGRRGWC